MLILDIAFSLLRVVIYIGWGHLFCLFITCIYTIHTFKNFINFIRVDFSKIIKVGATKLKMSNFDSCQISNCQFFQPVINTGVLNKLWTSPLEVFKEEKQANTRLNLKKDIHETLLPNFISLRRNLFSELVIFKTYNLILKRHLSKI